MITRCILAFVLLASQAHAETLYNGIVLPDPWPPQIAKLSREPLATPPYLVAPPAVISVDVGRQLFVDDFLIESTTMKRTFHRPTWYAGNPILKPDQPWEPRGTRGRAGVFSDGVWFDPKDQLFKMWYWSLAEESPRRYDTCLAVSTDGIAWEKRTYDVVPGTNVVLRDEKGTCRNSSTIWLDHTEKDDSRRFKMFRVVQRQKGSSTVNRMRLSVSGDGIHWVDQNETDTCGDRSTVFFNAFRNKWVFSLRSGSLELGRTRNYAEYDDPFLSTTWKRANHGRGSLPWIAADELDPDRADLKLNRGPDRAWDMVPSQLYNLDCVAYESVMLGFFAIWRGQPEDRPKINEICLGYSRDGFHFTRPDRKAFCGVSETKGDWNWGNVQSAGGGCLVVGDKLHFYVGGTSGAGPDPNSVGLATLRRDGFASMDAANAEAKLTTRPIRFSGAHLFVNVDANGGELRVEVLDRVGTTIEPFSSANCQPIQGDTTRTAVVWKDAKTLERLAGQDVRLRFYLRGGSLYSFWISRDPTGASGGYVAGGGPGFTRGIDQ